MGEDSSSAVAAAVGAIEHSKTHGPNGGGGSGEGGSEGDGFRRLPYLILVAAMLIVGTLFWPPAHIDISVSSPGTGRACTQGTKLRVSVEGAVLLETPVMTRRAYQVRVATPADTALGLPVTVEAWCYTVDEEGYYRGERALRPVWLRAAGTCLPSTLSRRPIPCVESSVL